MHDAPDGGVNVRLVFMANSAAQASAFAADLPFAGAMYSFFRALGQTLGVAISGAIFQNVFKKKILATKYSTFADEWSRNASSFVQVVKGGTSSAYCEGGYQGQGETWSEA
ncbi:hypothetical protein G7Y89_g15003 [Cudoniella acicularis]|uniref:Uncharacterized protein n=1 Tax=Cudoniella acicularis TaxID=354080 RepID=A0A8H4QW93_9HELO|nr:hypothetical protein G7Y89_g15003 [Cudoniella acicularis]